MIKSKSKFDKSRNYADFWMDRGYYSDKNSMFAGIGSGGNNDLVKAVKLMSYQRAIANFVRILTKKNIPVTFAGSQSYTDSKSVVIAADLGEKNFDVSTGLALHEASHILLTDFNYLTKRVLSNQTDDELRYSFKDYVNWIEDRRIDHFIFSTSPGYKAYYHKMYDHYFNHPDIAKALHDPRLREVEARNYLFHVINSLNPASDRNALPRLGEILDLIDVANISRLSGVDEVCGIAEKIITIIAQVMQEPVVKNAQPQKQQQSNTTSTAPASTADSNDQEEEQTDDSEEAAEDSKGAKSTGTGNSGDSDNNHNSSNPGAAESDNASSNPAPAEMPTLTDSQLKEVLQQLAKQREFTNGEVHKPTASKGLQRQLERATKSQAELQQVGTGRSMTNVLVYDLTDKYSALLTAYQTINEKYLVPSHKMTAEETDLYNDAVNTVSATPQGFSNSGQIKESCAEAIEYGLQQGGLLGKKLQVRGESRTMEHTRLRSGNMDNRRLAHAGYGVEGIFKQIHVDQYKNANLHISLDASGSMGGSKWANTLKMCFAICKAATYTPNLAVQVSLRTTANSNTPEIGIVYDSKLNTVANFARLMKHFSPTSFTPEGLCFEAMIAKKILKASNQNCDSYFLNISDGMPTGCSGYAGSIAFNHTKKQVDQMRTQLSMQVLSYYMTTNEQQPIPSDFITMYGSASSKHINADSALEIARTLNAMFLRK